MSGARSVHAPYGGSAVAAPHADLDRRGAEVERLADLALEVAQVGGGELGGGEQREGGGVARPLRRGEDGGRVPLRGGGGGGRRRLADPGVGRGGGHPPVVRLLGLAQR